MPLWRRDNNYYHIDKNKPLAPQLRSVTPDLLTLNLSYTHIGLRNDNELHSALPQIPKTVKTLILSGSDLCKRRSGKRVQRILLSIPTTVTSLDLSSNDLGGRIDLPVILAGISSGVVSLNLGTNRLDLQSIDALILAFTKLPATVHLLDLTQNWLCEKTDDELIAIIREVPGTVTTLGLSAHALGRRSVASLTHILSNLPPWVTSLDFGDNALGIKKTASELETILQSIPKTVKTLDLYNNDFAYKTEAELTALLKVLWKTGKNIIIEEELSEPLQKQQRMSLLFGLHSSHNQPQNENALHKAFSDFNTLGDKETLGVLFDFLPQYGVSPQGPIKRLTSKQQMHLQREAFNKIYQALRDGQSGIFKSNSWTNKESLTDSKFIQEITDYSARYPKSRTAKALLLTQAHYRNVCSKNRSLVTKIHSWCFAHSGFFFKQSTVTGKTYYSSSSLDAERRSYLTKVQISDGVEKINSRTYKICQVLGQ